MSSNYNIDFSKIQNFLYVCIALGTYDQFSNLYKILTRKTEQPKTVSKLLKQLRIPKTLFIVEVKYHALIRGD